MIIFEVWKKETGVRQAGAEGEPQTSWVRVDLGKENGRIWKPSTQEESWALMNAEPDLMAEEGVFVLPRPVDYAALGGKMSITIVSRGLAEVFMRTNPDKDGKYQSQCTLIKRGSPIPATEGIILIPNNGQGFEEQATVVFKDLGQTPEFFLRVGGKFTQEFKVSWREV